MSGAVLDPVVVEIIQNGLVSFIREMRGTIIRTAFGPIIWETHDFSCGLLAADGDLLALSEDNPVHIVPTMYSVPAVVERFGDAIAPGDIFVLNDPYRLGSHANDVAHLYPFFVEERLTFWIVVRVHYPDVGGMAPGSITPNATEVYQEGLLIPPIKAYDRGHLNDAFMDLFLANVRVPEERRGDFMAVIGAFWTADRRLREILASFGLEAILEAQRITSDRARQRMEEAIARLPEGEYAYELNLDSNGVSPGWVPLRVTIKVSHRPQPTLTMDFSESAAVVPGAMNGAPATAACAGFTAIKAFLDPHSKTNGGTFRPLRVVTNPGTIFEARPPSAMCGSLDLGYRVIELVMGALAAIREEDAVGDHSSPAHIYFPVSERETQTHYVFYEMPIGGTGAVSDHDGSDAVAGFERGDFPRISSVEVWEHKVPFFAVANELITDSGGAGRYRGGLGMRRSWRLLAAASTVSDLSEPCLVPGYGVAGGCGGSPSTCRVRCGEEIFWPGGLMGTGKATNFPLHRGDVVEFDKWGGGGYGDPLNRDPERVLRDMQQGYVSEQAGFEVYGVVLRSGKVDKAATAKRRRQIADARVHLRLSAENDDCLDGGTRVWRIAPEIAARLQAEEGEVLECLRPGRTPLRGKARIDADQPPDRLPAGPWGLKVLGAHADETVWLRKVHGALYPKV